MKLAIVFGLYLFSIVPAFAADVLELRSDKSTYSSGESAVLRASLDTRPADQNFEFDLVSNLNGVGLSVERTTDFEFFSYSAPLVAGDYTWEVTMVLQDKRYARDLKASILYFTQKIQAIDEELGTAPPEEVPDLEARKARYLSLKNAAEIELENHRTIITGPKTLQFQVQ